MIQAYKDMTPQIHPTARIAENATVTGDVTVGENVNIWYGVVARGDSSSISIGDNSNIQDNCVLHNDPGLPLSVGKNCVIGHGAILHSCTVEDNCLVGMGSVLLNGCVIGEGSLVGAGALVTENKVFPPRSLLMGIPARVVRTLGEDEVAHTKDEALQYIETAKAELPLAPQL